VATNQPFMPKTSKFSRILMICRLVWGAGEQIVPAITRCRDDPSQHD
jgi:hypothetical protein